MRLTYPLLPFIGVEFPHALQPFAPMKQAMPENVELLSLNSQYEQVGVQRGDVCVFKSLLCCQGYVLLRLRHMFEAGEHPTLSQPAQVDLAALFKDIDVVSMQEATLSGPPSSPLRPLVFCSHLPPFCAQETLFCPTSTACAGPRSLFLRCASS